MFKANIENTRLAHLLINLLTHSPGGQATIPTFFRTAIFRKRYN